MKLATTLLATAALSLTSISVQAADLTIVSWGGAYSASQNNAYHKPFMEMRKDVNIINDESSNEAVAKLRAMNEAGNVTWDVVDVEGPDSQRLCDEGLAMEINPAEWLAPAPDGTEAYVDFGPSMINKCFIPQIVFSTTFGYRTDVKDWNGAVPTSLCDIFDTKKFPGKRSLEKRPKKNIEWALLCDGVAKDDLYKVMSKPEGIQKALAKLDTIKKDVIWWTAGAETPQRLADGEAVIGSTYNGRLFSVIEEQKQPVAMLWDWQVFDFDGWIIPAAVKEDKLPLIKEYIKFATDTQRLADQAKYISYGPARASSQPLVGKHAELGIDMAPHMPTNPANQKNYLVNNIEWWADNQDEVEEAFQVWLAK